MSERRTRNLIVILGDQLNRDSAIFDGFDPTRDRIWMAEVASEANHVWSHKVRIAAFLSAMRHFRQTLATEGFTVLYHRLGNRSTGLAETLKADIVQMQPSAVVMAQAGEFRVQDAIHRVSAETGTPVRIEADRHFLLSRADFMVWAGQRASLRAEFLYRSLRRRTGILMVGDKPQGGRWNYDIANRKSFGHRGPPATPPPVRFSPDPITREVIRDVVEHFPSHPGSLDQFDWPMTPAQAHSALADFILHRLPDFGAYQDAMWSGEPYLFHSRLAMALNLKLISPTEVIAAALEALANRTAPLESVEGFVRQILGWREFIHGVYWASMPDYLGRNALAAHNPLPAFFWTAETEMSCLHEVIGQTLRHGYAHHIQRLMVTGLFALLFGVEPRRVHEWYLAIYIDAVEWVEAPNTLGMSQYADGGLVASKPYVASGRYIQRMSNYCRRCRFRPDQILGTNACPFTTLDWDFLIRHRIRFAQHPRTALQWRGLDRFDETTRAAIRRQAARLRANLA